MAEKEVKKSNAFDLEREYAVINGTAEADTIKSVAGIANWIEGGAGADNITGANAGDMLAGNQGDDVITAAKVKGAVEIYGGEGNDSLTGSAYADYIAGGEGADTIIGGKGNDILRGNTPTLGDNPAETDKDTFVFYKGDGKDVIREATADDVIKFADRTNFSGLNFTKSENDLVISDKYNTVTVEGYFTAENPVNTFELKNGVTYTLEWKESNVKEAGMYNIVNGTAEADTIKSVAGIANWIEGGAGADTITGGAGANTIIHHNGDGNDVINLTKGENFTLKVDNIYEIKIADNKKDVLVYTSETEYITIKNLASKDVTNNATKKTEDTSDVLLQIAGQDTPIDLRNYVNDWYPGYYVETNKNYTGTWLGEEIDATSAPAGKKDKGVSINAGAGNDFIYGSEFNDTLKGGDGDDYIWTMGGKDKVYGGNGNDFLIANAGETLPQGTEFVPSTLYGEKGNDTIEIWSTGDVAYGGDGEDLINLYNENNKTAFGGKGDDIISIQKGGATVYGEAGDDIINGGRTSASDIIFAKGAGHDTYTNRGAADTLVFNKITTSALSFENSGNDLVINYGKNESVTVKNYKDDMCIYIQTKDGKVLLSDLYVANKSNVFDDLKGDGVVEGEGRNYVVLNGDDKKNTINAMSGNSTWINAGAGNDVINGKNAYDMLAGNEGNDKINASKATGAVEIYGGADKDTLTGSAHNDWIAGNEGNDSIKGGDGDDTLLGGDHNKGSEDGNDVIYGEDGNDVILGGLDADTITGGAGKNTIIHHNGDGNDVINLTKGENFLLKVDTFDHVEIAANKKDVLVYTSDDEYITIKNLASKDVTNNATKNAADTSSVELKVGNETFDLRNLITDEDDKLTNADWGYPAYYKETDKNYTGTWLGEQIDATSAPAGKKDKGVSINAGGGNDFIYGSEFNDTLKGGDGDDYIWTYGGKDKVYGGNGNDSLIANAGLELPQGTEFVPSTLYGEKGNDYIEIWSTGDIAYGGDGDDRIDLRNENNKSAYGGKGNDTFVIEKGGATVYGEAGDDIIYGGRTSASNIVFAKGGGHDIYTNRGAADTLVFNKIATSALSYGVDGNNLVISYGKDSVAVKDYFKDGSSEWGVSIQTKNGTELLSEAVNIDAIKEDVASWLSTTEYTDVAEALANRTTDDQVANLVAIFENANINV